MFLIILGFLLLIMITVLIKNNPPLAKYAAVGRLAAVVLIVLGVASACV